jgi:pimeloyl-ACP methyl ester carboxylesterase
MGKLGKFWKTMIAGGAGMAALAAVNAKIQRGAKEPDDAVFGGTALTFQWKYGKVFYKLGGNQNSRPPLLLVHGIGAGSSSFTWRKNFDDLSRDFQVYAIDLLGFGLSEKPATAPYSAQLYSELISDFILDVIGRPVVAIASSLGAAYVVDAAAMRPDLVESMVLVSPTGAGNLSDRPGVTGAAFYGLLQSPVLGTSFYNVVASERSIRDYAMRQLFYDKRRVTNRFVAHHYATSHLPGAQHAIAAFLSGFLNTDIRSRFASLSSPIILVWGRHDLSNPIDNAWQLLGTNPLSSLELFDVSRMLPHEEEPTKFNNLVRQTFVGKSAGNIVELAGRKL